MQKPQNVINIHTPQRLQNVGDGEARNPPPILRAEKKSTQIVILRLMNDQNILIKHHLS